MAAFAYSAIAADGLAQAGEIHAPNPDAAREQLRIRGLLAERLEELPASGEEGARTAFKKVKPKTLQIFSRQFATMIEAGLNVVSSLVILEEQTDDEYFASVVKEIRADVEGGLLLSQALARHPKIFSRLYVSMVEAGEAAGILDQVLDRVAFQIEKDTQIRRRVKGAMMYPTMVMIFATLVLVGLLMFLVPVFVNIFAQLGGKLPTLTQYVVSASNVLRSYWFIIFPLFFLTIWAVRRFKRTEQGRQLWDRIKLKIPMKIGDVVLKVTMARFSRTLSTLVAAGVDIIKALEITGQTAGNWVVEEALSRRSGEGAPGRPDRTTSDRERRLSADGQSDGQDRRGDRRAREDALEDRGLLRGRGRLVDRDADVDHRAADDDHGRRHGRRDRHLDVPADVQDAQFGQVGISDDSNVSRDCPQMGTVPPKPVALRTTF